MRYEVKFCNCLTPPHPQYAYFCLQSLHVLLNVPNVCKSDDLWKGGDGYNLRMNISEYRRKMLLHDGARAAWQGNDESAMSVTKQQKQKQKQKTGYSQQKQLSL